MRIASKTTFQFSEKFSIHPASTEPAAPQFLQAMPASYGGASSSEGAAPNTQTEVAIDQEAEADEEFTIQMCQSKVLQLYLSSTILS